MLCNILEEKELPVYGDGKNIRDWLHVYDHNTAVWKVLNSGRLGETYNIGGENEWENIKLVNVLCEKVAEKTGKDRDAFKHLIKFIKDRPGHDRRYAINCDKVKNELTWKQKYTFEDGLDQTIDWYLSNSEWIDNVKSGDYQNWVNTNYSGRDH